MNQALIARTLAQALGGPGAAHGGGQYSKGYFPCSEVPLLSLFLMSSHFLSICTWFLRDEARPVTVQPLLENHQAWGAVLGRSARRNGASKWSQTLRACEGDLDKQAESFWAEAYAPCFICVRCETPLRSTRRGSFIGWKYPFYPLISYVFTFPKHLHKILRGEARPVPVWPLLENRQGAVLGWLARRNGASEWRQTLQTCGGELEEHAQIFWTEYEAFCLLRNRLLIPE